MRGPPRQAIGPARRAGRSGPRPRRAPRSPWREWSPSSLRRTGRRGARRQSRREFPEKIRPRVKFRRLPTVWPRGWIGVSTSAARIDARDADAAVRGESSARPAGRAAGIEPSTRLERVSNRVGRSHWREEENEHPAQPPGPDHARVVGSSGARRATIRARALTSRVTANVPRAFRADRVGVPRVPPGWVTARRLNGLYLRPHERYLRWRDELSSVASLAFRVYFLTDRHA